MHNFFSHNVSYLQMNFLDNNLEVIKLCSQLSTFLACKLLCR